MKMISKIMRSMRDTGLLEGVSDEDCDMLATAALEALRAPNKHMMDAGWGGFAESKDLWNGELEDMWPLMIDAALNE